MAVRTVLRRIPNIFRPTASGTGTSKLAPDSGISQRPRDSAVYISNRPESVFPLCMPSKLTFDNSRQLDQMLVSNSDNLTLIEKALKVELVTRDNWVEIDGKPQAVNEAEELFKYLKLARKQGMEIRQGDFDYMLNTVSSGKSDELSELFENPLVIKLRKKSIVPKTVNQKRYLSFLLNNEIVFGAGPAGTGKTYLAMAVALQALTSGEVEKIILTRPAVEAGEALGFLPGDLEEKILPYLRPLYDAMYDMLGKEDTHRLMERGNIEIAPLAYMRGRTLSNAVILLDEAQNTTPEQMMMFLTRLGTNGRMIISGDISQVDLPRARNSGLKEAVHVLANVQGIKVFYFDKNDVVRHPLVQRIINAYERYQSSPGRSDFSNL
ncbi:MAG: PhoH family protein [Opitutales bacterium]